MRYGIIANPKAGRIRIDRKSRILKQISGFLGDCGIQGLDTKSKEEFRKCANDLSAKVEVLVVAGGDGTFGDVINSVNGVALAYIPLGSGNGLSYDIGVPKSPFQCAERIRRGEVHSLDLILADDKKAFVASIGLEGYILNKRKKSRLNGFASYLFPTIRAFFGGYSGTRADIKIDDETVKIRKAITMIITKAPYFGYGLNLVPNAKFDDGNLHALFFDFNKIRAGIGLVRAIICQNDSGEYYSAKEISIKTYDKAYLQLNGDLEREGNEFRFKVLPKALKMIF